MKYILKIIILFVGLLALPVFTLSEVSVISEKNDLRGLWVATVLNIDYPSKPTTDPEILKSEAVKILDYAKETGFNAVFLQVRPTADAFYKSAYFPWSKYLTGIQGLAPANDFDPLQFWISEAHNRGIQLHAWINPYRITKNSSADPKCNFASLAPGNPAVLNPDWVVKYSDGNLYFNPGIPEIRKLIIDSVLEIIRNYNVDGIHFDDYFYPGKDFDDIAAYQQYGTGCRNIDDWRRANVDSLISELSGAIKSGERNIRFGISPFGIWANKGTNPLGSDTNGLQSFYDHYADTRKWVKDGLIDYIAPQIYWNIGYSPADYGKLLSWWGKTVDGTGVDLYIGQAAYRSGNSDPSSPWYGVSEIEKQLALNANIPQVKGSIFFNYKPLADNSALSAVIKAIYEQHDGIVSVIPVSVSRPSGNIKTYYKQFYLNGSSDPGKPLFLNGKLIENRSGQGFYGILVPLVNGENIFTFSQEASYVTRVIYRNTVSTTPQKMSAVGIPSSSVFPQVQEYRTSGEKITLSCQAPIGSKVTVKLGSRSYNMKPAITASYGYGAYATTFNYVYKIPSYSGSPRNINLGKPVYTMTYKGVRKTRTAPAGIGVIMKNSPFYARVTKDVIDTYQFPSSSDGVRYELYKGMADYVTGMTGSYIRLSSGRWVKKSGVVTYTSKSQLRPVIKKAIYVTGEKWDAVKLDISSSIAATASFDGTSLKLDISSASSAVLPTLPQNSLFYSVVVSKTGNKAEYIFKLNKNQYIDGYYVEKTSSGLILQVKRHVTSKGGVDPLGGITIMIDPGHGGNEAGAIGPLGLIYAEKTINLRTSVKLQTELKNLGAKVLMTRTRDKTLSLKDRVEMSRNARPDMFISLHANSMEDNIDMTKIDGLSVYYRETLAQRLADMVFENTVKSLNRNKQGIHIMDFYVIHGTWTPSILIETGFVPNPDEYEWLINENEQVNIAKSIADAIVKYFKHTIN